MVAGTGFLLLPSIHDSMEPEADVGVINADLVIVIQRRAVTGGRDCVADVGFLLWQGGTGLEVDGLSGRVPQHGVHYFVLKVVCAGAVHIVGAAGHEKHKRNQNIGGNDNSFHLIKVLNSGKCTKNTNTHRRMKLTL